MTAVYIDTPFQTTVLGLIIEVFATPQALEKISKPIDEDKAQALAALIADDMRTKLAASNLTTVVAAGLLDEPTLNDEELDIVTALEHCAEQHTVANYGIDHVALTAHNNGFVAIEFPQIVPTNPDDISYLGFCVPFVMVGESKDLIAFEDKFFEKDRERLHFADERIIDALTEAFGLEPGELKGVGYEDLDYASEALGAFSTHAKLIEIASAAKNNRNAFYTIKAVPVFVTQNKIRVGFFSFDAFARRLPHLQVGGDLEGAYLGYTKDFRFVVDILTSEGLSPIMIPYPSETSHVKWEEVLAAPKLENLFLEAGHRGLPMTTEGEAVSLDMICMRDPEDGAIVAATLSVLNDSGGVMAQSNIFPLTIDGMDVLLDYAKAIAQREGLDIDITEGDNLYINEELRALAAPPFMPSEKSDITTSRTLH